jgi:lysophospholipase L1-like esterase
MRTLSFCVLIILLFSCGVNSEQKLELKNKKIVILGDSITNAGAYVSYIEYYLQKSNPEAKYDIISVGLSSETASGLSEKDHPFPRPCVHTRLDNILKATNPDIISACYGMNDGIYHPQSPERMQAYKDGVLKLVEKSMASGVTHVILNTPPPFDPQPVAKKLLKSEAGNFSYKKPYYKYDSVLQDYSKWIMTLQMKNVTSVDFNTVLTDYLISKRKTDANFKFSRDGIHPSSMGHLMMAHTSLNGIGAGISFASLEEEYKKVNADPLYKLIASRRKMRSDGWLKYIGYKRGKTVKVDSVKGVEEKAAMLQKKIDGMK